MIASLQVAPTGYKQTEVGTIPEDWDLKSLGTFVALQRGHDLTERDRRKGEVPVMGSAGPNGYHDTALVRGPGVVVGRSGASFGQAHYCESDFWPHNTALYVTDFIGNYPLFAFYFLKSINFSRHNSGGAQQSLNRNFIAPIVVAVPKRAEQEIIAKALRDADAFIESLEQLLTKKRRLKQAAMQELLTGKKRLPGFELKLGYKKTEVGVIPEDWGIVRLGSHAEITKLAGFEYSIHFKSYKECGDIVVIRGTNITHNHLDLSDVKTIPKSTSDKLPRSKLAKDDLVFAYVGTIGPVFLIDKDHAYHLGPNTSRITVLPVNAWCEA